MVVWEDVVLQLVNWYGRMWCGLEECDVRGWFWSRRVWLTRCCGLGTVCVVSHPQPHYAVQTYLACDVELN